MRKNRQPFLPFFPVRRLGTALMAVAALVFVTGCASLGGGKLFSDADRLARQATDAMGGRRALDRTHYLRWRAVEAEKDAILSNRSLVWDRQTGRCRLETLQNGNLLIVLFNINTHTGKAFQNGLELPPSAQQPVIDEACQWFFRDSDWFQSIAGLFDPAAHREFAGDMTVQGRACPTLKVWFDSPTGLGARPACWLHFDPATHRPVAWSSAPPSASKPSNTSVCTQWQTLGPLTLPVHFETIGGKRQFLILDLFQPGEVLNSLFETPGMSLSHELRAPADAAESVDGIIRSRRGNP